MLNCGQQFLLGEARDVGKAKKLPLVGMRIVFAVNADKVPSLAQISKAYERIQSVRQCNSAVANCCTMGLGILKMLESRNEASPRLPPSVIARVVVIEILVLPANQKKSHREWTLVS